jgi:hypothetical protein
MMDYRDMLIRAKLGSLSAQEVAEVAQKLRSHNLDADPYTMLHIVGLAGGPSYRDLIEQYLSYPADPMLSRLALQIVCDFWGEKAQYRDAIAFHLSPVDWDRDDDVRIMALSCAGEYLREHAEPYFLKALIQTYANETETNAGARRLIVLWPAQ